MGKGLYPCILNQMGVFLFLYDHGPLSRTSGYIMYTHTPHIHPCNNNKRHNGLTYHGIFLYRYRWRSTPGDKTSNSNFDPTDFYMELATHLYEQGH